MRTKEGAPNQRNEMATSCAPSTRSCLLKDLLNAVAISAESMLSFNSRFKGMTCKFLRGKSAAGSEMKVVLPLN